MRKIYELAAKFWYQEFRCALSLHQFELAKDYFRIYQFWMRRVRLESMLGELCESFEKENAG
jgi:hypothetical protein